MDPNCKYCDQIMSCRNGDGPIEVGVGKSFVWYECSACGSRSPFEIFGFLKGPKTAAWERLDKRLKKMTDDKIAYCPHCVSYEIECSSLPSLWSEPCGYFQRKGGGNGEEEERPDDEGG